MLEQHLSLPGSLGSSTHNQMRHHLEENTNNTEDKLYATERERDKALDELRTMKKLALNASQEIAGLRSDLAKSQRRVSELETEVERAKESGTEMFDSLVNQMKKLEEVQLCLEDSKLEIAQVDSLRRKLKLAHAVEETTKKALDDLAFALKEVAVEANRAKEELALTRAELEHSRGEEERLAMVIKSNDEKFRRISEELKREAETHRNTAERLRLEAEETLLAWNDKEVGLVECLRKADEERSVAQRLAGDAESSNGKLRDILKQALSESRHAREAAEIARAESDQLRESLEAKEEALVIVAGENEALRQGLESVHVSDDQDVAIVAYAPALGGGEEAEVEVEEGEGERSTRKKRALMKRFGDLLIRKRSLRNKDFSD